VPGSWSPDYNEPEHQGASGFVGQENKDREREKSKSISKLFKRKPVSSKEGDLRVTNP
jgi:hypothetical protein